VSVGERGSQELDIRVFLGFVRGEKAARGIGGPDGKGVRRRMSGIEGKLAFGR